MTAIHLACLFFSSFLVECNLFILAGVAQLVEQLFCKQRVGGSNPSTSCYIYGSIVDVCKGSYPSGQRGQTVNLLTPVFSGSNPLLPTSLRQVAGVPKRSGDGAASAGVRRSFGKSEGGH